MTAPPASRIMRGLASLNEAGRLRLAIQKSGRLTESTLLLLRNIGLDFESYGSRLISHCENFPLSILYSRDDDIPELVARGTVDLGIVGRNLLHEEPHRVEELLPLGFGQCSLVVAVLRESPYQDPTELTRARIATSYPETVRTYFRELGGEPEIFRLKGSVEMAPALGTADAIADLSATGSSLILNDLRPIATILKSEAVLIANPDTLGESERREHIDRLLLRIRAVQAARRYKYVMMNAPIEALAEVRRVLPGLKAPTIIPLDREGFVAVHAAIREDIFWESVERLKEAGATEILVSSLEKLLL